MPLPHTVPSEKDCHKMQTVGGYVQSNLEMPPEVEVEQRTDMTYCFVASEPMMPT